MKHIHLCDYGVGNIYNVQRALEHEGAAVHMCTAPEQLVDVQAIVIPGVGAFGDSITKFRELGFENPVKKLVAEGVPLLGICVGMQMLGNSSEEHGYHEGLGIIAGHVKRLNDKTIPEGAPLRLPHISWSSLETVQGKKWANTPLENVQPGEYAYFVHSYAFECESDTNLIATCNYGGHKIAAVIQSGNVYGTQFHPEKSGNTGLKILNHFIQSLA